MGVCVQFFFRMMCQASSDQKYDDGKLWWKIGRYEKNVASACGWRHSPISRKCQFINMCGVYTNWVWQLKLIVWFYFSLFENLNLKLTEILRCSFTASTYRPVVCSPIETKLSRSFVMPWENISSRVQFAVTLMIAHMRSVDQFKTLCLNSKYLMDLRWHRFSYLTLAKSCDRFASRSMEWNIDSYRPMKPIYNNELWTIDIFATIFTL